jgi:hypothetical protein
MTGQNDTTIEEKVTELKRRRGLFNKIVDPLTGSVILGAVMLFASSGLYSTSQFASESKKVQQELKKTRNEIKIAEDSLGVSIGTLAKTWQSQKAYREKEGKISPQLEIDQKEAKSKVDAYNMILGGLIYERNSFLEESTNISQNRYNFPDSSKVRWADGLNSGFLAFTFFGFFCLGVKAISNKFYDGRIKKLEKKIS